MFRKVFLGRPVVWKGGCLQVRLVQKWETASHACLACNCGWFSNSCLLGITFSFVGSTRFSLGRSSMVWSVFKLSPSYCPYSPQKLCFVFSVIFFPPPPPPPSLTGVCLSSPSISPSSPPRHTDCWPSPNRVSHTGKLKHFHMSSRYISGGRAKCFWG